jgi:hypothetical protein
MRQDGAQLLLATHEADMDTLVQWLAQRHVGRLIVREPTLEDLFIRYYEGAPAADPGQERVAEGRAVS